MMPSKPAIRQPHQEMAAAATVVPFATREPKEPRFHQQQQLSALSEAEMKEKERQQMAQQPQI